MVTKLEYKIHFLNRTTVFYRVHYESFFNNNLDKLIFNNHYLSHKMVYNKYIKKNISLIERVIELLEFNRKKVFYKIGLNRRTKFNSFLNKPFVKIYSLYSKLLLSIIEKRINKNIN